MSDKLFGKSFPVPVTTYCYRVKNCGHVEKLNNYFSIIKHNVSKIIFMILARYN